MRTASALTSSACGAPAAKAMPAGGWVMAVRVKPWTSTIAIQLDWQDGILVAVVQDSGPPFDPRAAAPMVRAPSLQTVDPGGWGIHLIRAFANAIVYETKTGRNRLTLQFAHPSVRTTPTLTGAA
jgi:anti-sigma regulatory factor (Ser/Thr protein kinase)